MSHVKQTVARLPVLALALLAGAAGCGGSDEPVASSSSTQATQSAAAGLPPAPQSLAVVKGAARDLIDHALAGDRAAVVRNATLLARTAAGSELRAGGVPDADVALFQKRAAEVARLAPKAPLLDVALASGRAFAMVPGFVARFQADAPAGVTQLEAFDYEAELRAKAGDAKRFADVVDLMVAGWQQLRPRVTAAGGKAAVATYDAHVKAMLALAGEGSAAAKVKEAQHGLTLVDQLTAVFG